MGVIIERLPPIVKPPLRYNLIELDGNSRTDVETLGYKAYEKIIPIGFKEDNVDYVLNWLTGTGKLILSNEPDKYYNVFILEQIDYVKALRYRKADVPFLIQPYKYAVHEYETTSTALINQGNVDCFPLITIYGSGTVDVLVNSVEVCTVTIDGYITLDCEEQDAKNGTVLKNRSMVGKFPVFAPGLNALTFNGTVTQVTTLVRSRWI
jgi:phage-related protein